MTTLDPNKLLRVLLVAWDGLNGTAPWLMTSFVAAGILRNLLSPARLQRALGNARPGTVMKAVLSGLLLPICSCGIIPVGISLYYSGAYLGPTLAFMTAAPVTNPAALLLSFGFLGPKLAALYIVSGVAASLVIGLLVNALAGPELFLPGTQGNFAAAAPDAARASWKTRLKGGALWGLSELGPMVSKYVCLGMILMGVIAVLIPQDFIKNYLGRPSMLSLAGVAMLGAVMYICAVGHIPFIAMLVASGAAPGVAVTFLMAGVATNLPELMSLWKLIGRRCAVLYFILVSGFAFAAGHAVNLILMPDFVPFMDVAASVRALRITNAFSFTPSHLARTLCAVAVLVMGLSTFVSPLRKRLQKVFGS
jgi:uncharacterized membrane protein YraQ (UPF0718 family)